MKIVFFTAEAFPFAKVGGLADVCGALPLVLEKLGCDVSIVMPRYKSINPRKHKLESITKDFSVATIGKNIRVYFVESEKYFDRDGIYGDENGGYADNLDRFQFYCVQGFELLKQEGIKADILHCHDWHAALVPVYLKFKYRQDPAFAGTQSILTIHNLAYQGIFPKQQFSKLGLDSKLFSSEGFEFFDQINILKAGIVYSDMITTVSPRYSEEIQSDEFGCGLDGVLRARHDSVAGILNGLDYNVWNPANDPMIVKPYSSSDICGKKNNKSHLQQMVGLPVREEVPVFGFVGRLASQKGLDLISKAIDQMGHMDIQIIFQGIGEEKYHHILRDMVQRYPQQIAFLMKFEEKSAHQIYAGSDFFLMPSHYEPCGLGQLIALRYGTVPLVFKVGGLADTIESFNIATGQGNGFVFDRYERDVFISTCESAVKLFQNKKDFQRIMQNAFASDFSWEHSAKEYEKLYARCASSR